MSDKNDKPEAEKGKAGWGDKALIAGAAIGSAALAAALLYASRRKEQAEKPTATPPHPEDAPETD